jgi:hypothetical protein
MCKGSALKKPVIRMPSCLFAPTASPLQRLGSRVAQLSSAARGASAPTSAPREAAALSTSRARAAVTRTRRAPCARMRSHARLCVRSHTSPRSRSPRSQMLYGHLRRIMSRDDTVSDELRGANGNGKGLALVAERAAARRGLTMMMNAAAGRRCEPSFCSSARRARRLAHVPARPPARRAWTVRTTCTADPHDVHARPARRARPARSIFTWKPASCAANVSVVSSAWSQLDFADYYQMAAN